MSMKIKPEAVASIRKMAAVCQGKNLSTKQAGLDRFVQGYLTIFHLWEDEEALREMAGYVRMGVNGMRIIPQRKKNSSSSI